MAGIQIDGLWKPVACEVGGVAQPLEQVARMGRSLFLLGEWSSGWDGLWAIIRYGHEGGAWTEAGLRAICVSIIFGIDSVETLPSDCYLFAGGRLRISEGNDIHLIEMQPFYRGSVLPTTQTGVASVDDARLTICTTDCGNPQPVGLRSDDHPDHYLQTLMRVDPTASESRAT